MAQVDVELPVTREELEATLRREGFIQQHGSSGGSVWWSQDRTKFVCFPDDASGEAIYGDSEIGEPGKTVPIAVAGRVVRGEFLLDSPLGVMPAQQRDPAVLAAHRAPRGLTADDPLPALPAATEMNKHTWFVRPGSSDRHETLRPPPSDRPAQTVVPALRAHKIDQPFATEEWARFYRVTVKLRAPTLAATFVFFVGLFLSSWPRALLVYPSFAVVVGVFGTIVVLLVLAWRSKKSS